MKTIYVIGIAGGSGSGKSTFAKRLKNDFEDDILLISCDDYYLPHDELSYEERCGLNYDTPDALEFSLLVENIKALKRGECVEKPMYDFSSHARRKETQTVEPKKIVIVDGILTFAQEELRDLFDLKIYVETDADERILRRVRRDVCERNRSIDSVIEQYVSTVKPMHYIYVEPTKVFADIITNGGMNRTALEVIKCKLEKVVNGAGGECNERR